MRLLFRGLTQGGPWYTLAKVAEISFMKNYALKFVFVSDGFTFNSVAPGAILTKIGEWDNFKKNEPQKLTQKLI